MEALRTVLPPSRFILNNIRHSFHPGAKIGALSPNGAGKSSLLRIMAGVDAEFQGEAWPHEGTKIGWLPQEHRSSHQRSARQRRVPAFATVRKRIGAEEIGRSPKRSRVLDMATMTMRTRRRHPLYKVHQRSAKADRGRKRLNRARGDERQDRDEPDLQEIW